MKTPQEILKKYWNYDDFRPPQEEIINAVLEKKDVIALLPTGGGKSICFQIPALLLEGVCVVISPLIALMQDQVTHLKARNIKATTIASNISEDEIVSLFDTIKFDNYKFLYLSPERLQSALIQQKLQELTISCIAIDEAHCISEWGHDFRPAYRNINILKNFFPNIKFIALTATATKKVLDDMQHNLGIHNPSIFTKTFERKNLAYQIFDVEDKLLKLEQIFSKTKTPAIVYVNSRRKTEDICNYLNRKGFNSEFYHGGLSTDQKTNALRQWLSEEKRIMIATNAFGMGIDKENVGVVIHYDLPFSMENYIQESGRAGRNNKKAFAVLLKNEHDVFITEDTFKKNLPTLKEIKEVHKKLYQYFSISPGEISDNTYPFQLLDFCKIYNFDTRKVGTILQILANNSILEITNTYRQKSTIIFTSESKIIQKYVINNIYIENFINSLLRTYTGLFQQKVKVDEFYLAKKNNCTSQQIIAYLKQLHRDEILIYNRVKTDAEIRFLLPREDDKTINRFSKIIEKFINQKEQKLSLFLHYIGTKNVCRSIQILHYFDEKSTKECGICDVCLSKKKSKTIPVENAILSLLTDKKLTSQEIMIALQAKKETIILHLQNLLSQEKITINSQNKYQLNH